MNDKISLFRNSYFKSVGALAVGDLVSQLIVFSSVILIARLYSPADIGVYALVLSVSTILSVVVSGRYEFAVMNPSCEKEASQIIMSAIVLAGALSLIFYSILLFVVFYSQQSELSRSWIYTSIPILALLISWHSTLVKWSNRRRDYAVMSYAKVLTSAVSNYGPIVFYWLSNYKDTYSLVLFYVLGLLVSCVIFVVRGDVAFGFSSFSVRSMLRIFASYWRFPAFSLPQSLISTSIPQVPIFFLSAFFSSEITGTYSLVQRILGQPITLLANNVGSVFHRRLIGAKNTEGGFYSDFKTILSIMGVAAALLAVGVLFLGELMFGLVLGEKYVGAALVAQILLPATMARMLAVPVANVFLVFDCQYRFLRLQFVHFLLIAVAYSIGGFSKNVTVVLAFHAGASFIAYSLIINSAKKLIYSR